MTFQSILKKYRADAYSERDKGDRIERLMQAYLRTEPIYADKFSDVWLWEDFPYRAELGGNDTGIDIVARTEEGEFWAVQCKFYDEKTSADTHRKQSTKDEA